MSETKEEKKRLGGELPWQCKVSGPWSCHSSEEETSPSSRDLSSKRETIKLLNGSDVVASRFLKQANKK